MTRSGRFVFLLLLSGALLAGGSWAHTPPKPPAAPGVVHVVLVWLKDAGNAEHRQQVISGSKQLADIPGVLDLRVGTVIPSDRDVVDASYDVALYLRFASEADLQAYLVHPTHKTTVKEVFVPIMDHYRVMDFRDE